MTVSHSDTVLRLGVIGCGVIGPTHAGAIRQIDGITLAAVADTVAERAAAMARQFDVPRAYHSHTELLADPEIDAVTVCTPSGTHAAIAVDALRAGKHVIVEKPMDVSLEACDRMIAAAADTGRTLAVISQHRFDAATQLAKSLIDSGRIGEIVLADATVKWWRTQEYYDSGDWRGTWALDGGGALMNQGIHTVDLLQWLAGDVASICGRIGTRAHERIEVEDAAVAALTFKNGAIGTLTATTAAYPGYPVRIDIYGTLGSLVLEGDRLRSLQLKTGEQYASEEAAAHALAVARGGTAAVKDEAAHRSKAAEPGAAWGDAHRMQIEDFIHAIRTGSQPLMDGLDGRAPVEIVLGVYRSARTNRPVTLAMARPEPGRSR